jgi:hypothetical protein
VKEFSDEEKCLIWYQGIPFNNFRPDKWMRDKQGKLMLFSEYENRDSEYGWKIDRINPNDGDHPSNLQPILWTSKVIKSDHNPFDY